MLLFTQLFLHSCNSYFFQKKQFGAIFISNTLIILNICIDATGMDTYNTQSIILRERKYYKRSNKKELFFIKIIQIYGSNLVKFKLRLNKCKSNTLTYVLKNIS